ncbi:MAG: glycoside hydrolase family 127 protein [Acidobacteria bacterium]|nr:glycoside hydrolase family 127 protein [Acidobacteriota bacterium]
MSYLHVKMQDTFWVPRQKTVHDVSVEWVTSRHDKAGGLEMFKKDPEHYVAGTRRGEMEHIKFIEAMANVIGVRPDPAIAGLIDAWAKPLIDGQGADGYLGEHFPSGLNHPPHRWQAVWWSHEDYTIGHYLEAAIAYREVTGREEMYRSAVRAVDNMAAALLYSNHAYTSGHPEIEQALMRLYGLTGNTKYLRLSGLLLGQRGHHEGRPSYGRMRQDDIPVKDQRTIEGHAVMAGYLFNGVTHYVGATGDAAYREAALSVWDDFVNRKMYLHGAGGNKSAKNEGYRKDPYCILPEDTYGESCSVFANFQWAHSLFRLTGEARYIDTAERMLYNAFYASLSLKGDSSFYCNVAQTDVPTPRSPQQATGCCPPNIVKLFNKVGGFFYSTDQDGVYVKHYGASEATIPWGGGVKLTQRTGYPWDGTITVLVESNNPQSFTLRLRVPAWAKSHALSVNGQAIDTTPQKGWLAVHRHWKAGDQVELSLPMEIERVTMPPQFKEYENRAALQRGPIVYCLEQQDLEVDSTQTNNAISAFTGLAALYIPEGAKFKAEHRPDFLGGVTVLRGEVRQLNREDDGEKAVSATFVPYGVWDNRTPGEMRIWLGARKVPLVELLLPEQALGESCVG